jgi:hypothetical protein
MLHFFGARFVPDAKKCILSFQQSQHHHHLGGVLVLMINDDLMQADLCWQLLISLQHA